MTIDFDLSDPSSFRDYFKEICTRHKRLGPDAFLYGDTETAQAEASTWTGLKLWAWPSEGGRAGSINDNYHLLREGAIWVGGACQSERYEDVTQFYFACEILAMQVVSKMVKDYSDALLSFRIDSLNIKRADMEFSATKLIGCEITFNFHDPNNFQFDETNWL